MKKYIIAAIAAFMTFGVGAVEYAAHSLVITKKSGETVEYKFTDRPVATFAGDDMDITLALTGQKISYPAAEVASLTVTPRTLGVESIATDGTTVSFELTGSSLICNGLTPSAAAALYTIDGKLAATAAADSDGKATLPLESLGAGVYIVKAAGESFKFTTK